MSTVTLKFNNLLELWEFLKYIGRASSRINFDSSELTGYFSEAEIKTALNKMNASLKDH